MTDVTWHEHAVRREDRVKLLRKGNHVLWFTGLSGSGKSTIANIVASRLHEQGRLTYVLDGDNVRHGLSSDLGFSSQDRSENIRRVTEVAKLMYDAGITVLVSFISPFRNDREHARAAIGTGFVEIFVACPLEVCERRDVKGLYARARAGELEDFTGITSPYEPPMNADVHLDSDALSAEKCAQEVMAFLEGK